MKVKKLVLSVGVVLFLFICSACQADSLIGQKAPEITIRGWLTSNPPDIKNVTGRVYVLEFWATWCGPCIKNIPHLVEINEKYKDRGLVLIGMCQDRLPEEKLRSFIAEKGMTYHVALDNGSADWFGIKGYPTAVIIDHTGKVVWSGYPGSWAFEIAIEKALKKAPPPLVAGVELGKFAKIKDDLWGGKKFAAAYSRIKSQAQSAKNRRDSEKAQLIIDTIDRRIAEKLHSAERVGQLDAVAGCEIYRDVFARYSGIDIVDSARSDYLKLQRQRSLQNSAFAFNSEGVSEEE